MVPITPVSWKKKVREVRSTKTQDAIPISRIFMMIDGGRGKRSRGGISVDTVERTDMAFELSNVHCFLVYRTYNVLMKSRLTSCILLLSVLQHTYNSNGGHIKSTAGPW